MNTGAMTMNLHARFRPDGSVSEVDARITRSNGCVRQVVGQTRVLSVQASMGRPSTTAAVEPPARLCVPLRVLARASTRAPCLSDAPPDRPCLQSPAAC